MRRDGDMNEKDYEELLRDGWLPERDHVFVSYSGLDREKVYPCVAALRARGINVYIDSEFRENGSSSWLKNFQERLFRDSSCKGIVTFLSIDYLRSYPCLIEQMANRTYKIRKRRGRVLPVFYVALDPELSTVQKMAAYIHEDGVQKESAKEKVRMAPPERSMLARSILDSGFARYRDEASVQDLLDDMEDKLDVMTTMYELIFSQEQDMPNMLPFEGAERCAQLLMDNFVNDKNASIKLPVLEELKRETEERLSRLMREGRPEAAAPVPQEPSAGEPAPEGQTAQGPSAGQGGRPALPDSVKQLIDRAERGDAAAQDRLGWMYKDGKDGLERSLEKAAEWFRRGAEQGHAASQKDLAWMYKKGWGVERSREKATEWLRKAAEGGNASAQNELAWLYKQGQGGVERSREKATEWLRRAAEGGNASAQNELAWLYKQGQGGLGQSDEKAAEWFRRAAEQGHSGAQCSLGIAYASGRGVKQSWEQAVHWYGLAAEQGYQYAAKLLAGCYEKGLGVAQDREKAAYWSDKAKEGKAE